MKSAQPKKQRKYLYTMPLHKRWHLFNAKVFDKEGNKLGRDRIKKGVLVKVMRGNFKGHIGKVVRIDRKKVRVYVEGCTRKTQRGTEVLVPIHPSNLCIIKGD
jgi:large subunit ribosomal protein L24